MHWVVWAVIVLVVVLIIIKMVTRKKDNGDGLTGALDYIKRRFDDVCKKISKKSGC